ncbi:Ubiquitin domain-containing protein DSK2b [Nosema granulosis]|uniref:Ubiquitin domain-containing protein DSK2b n=1 Tax=Nosema granulosis TaxID=83296 RepID=A0A9P6KZF4_9MICR|nr:Ubiquitin domain-containing protein DSK2b [Nosema granulosis]
MVKLFIIAEGTKINIELDSLDITSEEFKKIIEKNMKPEKAIPHDKQSVFINKNKLTDGKKLSEYITSEDKEVKVFVLRQSKNVLSGKTSSSESKKTDTSSYNPYSQQPPRNPYEGVQNMQLPNWGYPSPNQSYGQPPAFGYGSPGQGFSQMPPMSNLISKEQIDLLLNNPQFLDQIIDIQSPGLSPEEKESKKNMYRDCFKMLKNDPSLMNSLNSMAPELLRGGMNMPPMPGMPPQQPPSPYGYPPQFGMPPQQPPNPYYQQPYYGYPPYGGMPPYGAPIQPPMSPSHYEGAYALQLQALEEMGFVDKKENLEALIKTNGDINAALDYLRKDENFKKN